MAITVTWTVPAQGLTDGAIARIVEAALAHGARSGVDLAVVLADDALLQDLHARYFDDPSPTDVIAFELGEDGGPAGEVYVSVDRARDVAARRGGEFGRELALYLVHGALHLCGYDDGEEGARARMRAAEAEVLAQLGFAEDRGLFHA